MDPRPLRAAMLATLLVAAAATPVLAHSDEEDPAVAPVEASVVIESTADDPTVTIEIDEGRVKREAVFELVAALEAALQVPRGVEWTAGPVDFVVLGPGGVEWTFQRRSWEPQPTDPSTTPSTDGTDPTDGTGEADGPGVATETPMSLGVEWTR